MTAFIRSITIGAIVLAVAAPAAHAQAQQKFAYVQLQKVMQESPGRTEAEQAYDKEATAARAEVQRMDDSLSMLVRAFEKELPKLDSVQRESRSKPVRDVEERFRKRAAELNQRMQERQAELSRPLMEQLSRVLDEIRKQNNYAFIFDVNAQGSGIVSADSTFDVTEQVLTRLKQLGPPKAPTSQVPLPAGPATRPAGATRPRG